jgi:benzoate/toluate 1,2-dioxygenase alpha subunit
VEGPDAAAEAIGPKLRMSGVKTEDEGLFVVQHKYWQEAMRRALAAEVGQAQG